MLPGYHDEDGVAADSKTETYIAAKFQVDNWRWAGVPFYLRTGKRLPERVSEIAIQFRRAPHVYLPDGKASQVGALCSRTAILKAHREGAAERQVGPESWQ